MVTLVLGLVTAAWLEGGRPRDSATPGNSGEVGGGCVIKGNISGGGERIYHVPGGQFYEQTRINAAREERWFCSETEARAAGWRKTKR